MERGPSVNTKKLIINKLLESAYKQLNTIQNNHITYNIYIAL